jgi:hypothetical protein
MGTTAGMLAAARSDLGYREGPGNDTKFGDWYGLPHQPWCDMAVSYWAAESGNGLAVGKFAWTPAHAHWFAQQGRFGRQPHTGDIVFFAWSGPTSIDAIDHVGVIEAVRDDGSLVTLEGNSDDMVARHVRRACIVGYGHPAYSAGSGPVQAPPWPGRYLRRITGTLRFYDSQTISGDAKGRSRPGTRIVVSGGIAAFRSAHHPFLTRDVLIRDLGIWNMQGTDVAHGGVSDSVAVDFTGVGFSGLQRLSVDYHEIGIIGRDTATFSTTVRADSAGTVLKIPASYPDFAAPGEQVTVNDPSAPPDVTSTVRIVKQVTDASDPNYPAFILSSNTPLQKTYHQNALVYPSPIGGYYVSVEDCEINQCRKGLWLSHAANNWTVLGGRFAGNDYGIYAEHIDGSSFQSAFEHNGAGVLFHATAECQVRSGSYFEGNGPDNIKDWGGDKLEPTAPGTPPPAGPAQARLATPSA